MLANIRPLPGLYGGGFARVVQVETLPSGSFEGAAQAAVRLERLQDPLAGFRQALTQYSEGKTVSTPQQPIDGGSVTLLQNVDPQQPLVPPFPPEQQPQTQNSGPDDQSSYAIELARAEARRKDAITEQRQEEERRAEAIRQFEQAAQEHQQNFGPDPLEKLRQALEKQPTDLTALNEVSYSDVAGSSTQTSTAAASLAAQAYANTLAATA